MLSGLICEPHMCSELKLDMMNQLVNESVRDRPRSDPLPSTTPREFRYVFIPLSLINRRATSKLLKRDCECEEAS